MVLLLSIVHVLTCIVIIAVILLQSGKGGGLGAGFGGASSAATQIFGGRGAGNFLSRSTVALAVVFMITSMGLAYMSSRPNSLLDLTETSGSEVADADTVVEQGSGELIVLDEEGQPSAEQPPPDGATNTIEIPPPAGGTEQPSPLSVTPEVPAEEQEEPVAEEGSDGTDVNVEPEATPEPKPEAKPEPKPEAKPEPKPEAKPEPKPEAKPEPKPEPPAEEPEAKPEPPAEEPEEEAGEPAEAPEEEAAEPAEEPEEAAEPADTEDGEAADE